MRDGYRNVSHRGYTNSILEFDDCRLPASQVLGEVHKGFEVANSWLGATRLQVGATCLGRAERALGHAIEYAAQRQQFGQQIGKFQGVSFKLADMATELKAAELMIIEAGWKYDQGTVTDQDMAMAKLKATEMLAFVADEAIQIHGGMGLMDDLPLERIWRDARVERIWEGTSEIQRHIISRALLQGRVGGADRGGAQHGCPSSTALAARPRKLRSPSFGGRRRLRPQRRQAVASRWALPATSGRCIRARTRSQGVKAYPLGRRPARRAGRRLRRRQPHPHHRHHPRACANAAPAARSASPPASSRPATTMPTASGCRRELVEAAGDMPIIGPNCYGLINYADGALLWPDQHGGLRLTAGDTRRRASSRSRPTSPAT